MKKLNVVLEVKEVNTINAALKSGCQVAQLIQKMQVEKYQPTYEDWELLNTCDNKALVKIAKRFKSEQKKQNESLTGTKKEQTQEIKDFRKELDYLSNVRKVLNLKLKHRTVNEHSVNVEGSEILNFNKTLFKNVDKQLEAFYKTMEIEPISGRAILARNENNEIALFFEKGIFSLIGTLTFKEVMQLVYNFNKYGINLVQKMYVRFSELSNLQRENCYFQAAKVNPILNACEFEGFDRAKFDAICEIFGFVGVDKFANLADLKNKHVAQSILDLYPYQFDKYSSLRKLWKDKEGAEVGSAFASYVVDKLGFANITAFNLAIKEATQEQTLNDVKAAIFDTIEAEAKAEGSKVNAEAVKKAEAKAANAEAKAEAKAEARILSIRQELAACELTLNNAEGSQRSKAAAAKKAEKLQSELNELQGIDAPLNPAKLTA